MVVALMLIGSFVAGSAAGGLAAFVLCRSNRRRIDGLERRVRSLGVVDEVVRSAVPHQFELGEIRRLELIDGVQPASDRPPGVRRSRRT